MDPIGTAFLQKYAFIGVPLETLHLGLSGGVVEHRFVDRGWLATAHTSYIVDRPLRLPPSNLKPTFVEILLSVLNLRSQTLAAQAPNAAEGHWKDTSRRLWRWMWGLRVAGILCLFVFACWAAGTATGPAAISRVWPALWILPFLAPPFVIGALAFFQNLVWGASTARISEDTIEGNLPMWSPFRIRQELSSRRVRRLLAVVLLPSAWLLGRRGWEALEISLQMQTAVRRFSLGIVSLLPSLAGMVFLWWLIRFGLGAGIVLWPWLLGWHWGILIGFLYLLSFAAAEILRHWRNMILAIKPGQERAGGGIAEGTNTSQ